MPEETSLEAGLAEALEAMLAHYGPSETVAHLCDYPATHPITKAREALARFHAVCVNPSK